MRSRNLDDLVGRTICAHDLESDGSALRLWLADGGMATLIPVGDCCSETWIESIDNPSALRGTIRACEEIPMPDLGNVGTPRHPDVDRFDVVDYYGLRVVTELGHCTVDFRNESNGWYGGWLELEVD